MQVESARINSFRVKDCPFSTRKRTGLTVAKLVNNGFYYIGPGDTVACYLCDCRVLNWSLTSGAETQIIDRHGMANKSCPLVLLYKEGKQWIEHVLNGLRPYDAHAADAPWSIRMEKARAETFVNWPHTDPHCGCTPLQMSQAGFIYTPEDSGDDHAECLYCHLALGGWEPTDDPRIEHMKRRPDCLFLDHEQLASKSTAVKGPTIEKEKEAFADESIHEVAIVQEEPALVDPFALTKDMLFDLDNLRQGITQYLEQQQNISSLIEESKELTVEALLLKMMEKQKTMLNDQGNRMIQRFQETASLNS